MTYRSWDDAPIILSISEASRLMGLSRAKGYELVHSNKSFPVIKIDGRYLVPKEALKKWIDDHTQK